MKAFEIFGLCVGIGSALFVVWTFTIEVFFNRAVWIEPNHYILFGEMFLALLGAFVMADIVREKIHDARQ